MITIFRGVEQLSEQSNVCESLGGMRQRVEGGNYLCPQPKAPTIWRRVSQQRGERLENRNVSGSQTQETVPVFHSDDTMDFRILAKSSVRFITYRYYQSLISTERQSQLDVARDHRYQRLMQDRAR